jgi:hypothetical protein
MPSGSALFSANSPLDQIRDAFHAAGYSELETNAYTQAVRSRIHELNSL